MKLTRMTGRLSMYDKARTDQETEGGEKSSEVTHRIDQRVHHNITAVVNDAVSALFLNLLLQLVCLLKLPGSLQGQQEYRQTLPGFDFSSIRRSGDQPDCMNRFGS